MQTAINHRNAMIIPRERGVDVIDNETGKWFHTHSIRSAKWNVAVWRRLSIQFQTKETESS